MKPYTFSNGVVLPKGTTIFAPLREIQKDRSVYKNPDQFDGFRFSKLREECGESAIHHCSNTGLNFIQFGHGHHAW